jgi:MFS family permease
MISTPRAVQRTYLFLLLLNTLAASFIWGINTLFLLDAGLDNTQAFAANAFFTAGLMLFEIPTGVVADTRGRRLSYLLGTITLAAATAAYVLMWRLSAPFWAWAVVSVLLGLGFSFFSGAFEAWLVDALAGVGYEGPLDAVLAKGEIVQGAAMLVGSAGGGLIAQVTNLGVPYVIRTAILALAFVAAFVLMRDVGFTPQPGRSPLSEVKRVMRASVKQGLGNRPVRWIMLGAPFAGGASIYAFYAMQPYLLQLYGKKGAYSIAGLAAAAVAAAQIAGGLLVPRLGRIFRRRTGVLLAATSLSAAVLGVIAFVPTLAAAIALMAVWALMFATVTPVRQAYLNGLIPSSERATVLSFDSLMSSAGAAVIQPPLGRAADVWGYPASYGLAAAAQALALPFLLLARRERASSDAIGQEGRSGG